MELTNEQKQIKEIYDEEEIRQVYFGLHTFV
jgi:hypothetical protein